MKNYISLPLPSDHGNATASDLSSAEGWSHACNVTECAKWCSCDLAEEGQELVAWLENSSWDWLGEVHHCLPYQDKTNLQSVGPQYKG